MGWKNCGWINLQFQTPLRLGTTGERTYLWRRKYNIYQKTVINTAAIIILAVVQSVILYCTPWGLLNKYVIYKTPALATLDCIAEQPHAGTLCVLRRPIVWQRSRQSPYGAENGCESIRDRVSHFQRNGEDSLSGKIKECKNGETEM